MRISFKADARTIEVKNKPERIANLTEQITTIQKTRIMSKLAVAELRGKMTFSNSQVNGRVGAVALNILGRHQGGRIKQDLSVALDWWMKAVSERAKPRTIQVGDLRPPILIFTDGAHEEEGTGYGGVMIDPLTNEVAGFGRNMGKELIYRL